MNKVLITPRSLSRKGHPAFDLLRKAGYEVVLGIPGKQPSEEELLELLPGCVGYLAGIEKISAKALESAKDLKVISRNGVGIDNIDLDAAKRLGISVQITAGANSQGVAELALALIFASIRSIPFSDAQIKLGQWQRKKGIELDGRTLGIIGCGNIGKRLANMALGIGMNVLANDICAIPSFTDSPQFKTAALDELIKDSDIISLHCPALENGKPLIDSAVIETMKEGIYLINTARASLIDSDAVLEALDNGRIAGYATDVYENEPPEISALITHERVITTPHVGSFTAESVARATYAAVENILKIVNTQ